MTLVAPPVDRAANAAAEIAEIAPELTGVPFRDAWRRLVATASVSSAMADSLRGTTGDGAVQNAVAVVEGAGRAGVPAGLCYALASQLFGIQWPLSALPRQPLAPYADRLLDGSMLLCHALTEETGGSDPLSMNTAAHRLDDGSLRIDGRKAYVTAAPAADLVLAFARTEAQRHPFALSAFLIPADRPGVVRSEPFDKTALTEVPMGAIDFNHVAATDADMVTTEGSGLAFLSSTTAWERALLMSYSVGLMRATVERAVTWLRERKQFGRGLGSNPLVAARVSDLSIIEHRVRTLVYDMARRIDAGTPLSALATEAAQVKISCAQDLVAFETAAAPLFGARAVVADSGYAINFSSAVAASIYAGTNDLLRVVIARDLGLPVEN
ncbi:acyl-CoA dehydrogenase family protein [Gordonia sp. NPDC003422]